MNAAPPLRTESGSTIALAMFTILILGGFVALAVDYTGNIGRNARRDRVFANAVEIGDGCLEIAFGGWRRLSATSTNPATSLFDAIPTPSPGDFPSFPGAVISNFDVQAVDPLMNPLSGTATPPPTTGPGSGTKSYFYLATVDVTLPHATGTLTAKVRRVFEKRYTSAWNWAMLYNEDLELHPNSNLTLDGWVHSNKNVYIGNGTMDPFTPPPPNVVLQDRLTYAGNYTVGHSPLNLAHAGQLNVAAPIAPADMPPGSEQAYYPFDWDPTKFNLTDSSTDNDGWREMIERSVATTEPFAGQRLYDQANIAITIDAANSVKVYTGTGKTKTYTTSSSGSDLAPRAVAAAANAVKPGYLIQDNREQASGGVRVVDFDISEFIKTFPSNRDPTEKGFKDTVDWNGIVYISDISANPAANPPVKRAIRIVKGAKLPRKGITIVSDNPIYIQGDFNTGSNPPSNSGTYTDPDGTDPVIGGEYKREPASIVADAISLLSNNWQDGNSADLTARKASNTTVNAALIAGNVPSDGTAYSYSGGGENFVRLLEDWTGQTFTYYGSMLNLFKSKQGTGAWSTSLGGAVYLPPELKWFFDSTLSVDGLGEPIRVPGHLSTVAYLQQQRWYLQY